MALFRRGKRRRDDPGDLDETGELDEAGDGDGLDGDGLDGEGADTGDDADQPGATATSPRPQGPWDVEDAPEDDVQRLDLGSLLVPMPEGAEVRVEVSPEGQVYAATIVRSASSMQLMAFAAPRTEGIWAEVRAEIAADVTGNGGTVTETEGQHGVELQAQVPTEGPGGARLLVPARFTGIDGPRWFLRATLSGPAATDRAAAAELERSLRDVVVVRGSEAMVVRDLLPLRLPREVQEAAEQHAARTRPAIPERGPEITEIR